MENQEPKWRSDKELRAYYGNIGTSTLWRIRRSGYLRYAKTIGGRRNLTSQAEVDRYDAHLSAMAVAS